MINGYYIKKILLLFVIFSAPYSIQATNPQINSEKKVDTNLELTTWNRVFRAINTYIIQPYTYADNTIAQYPVPQQILVVSCIAASLIAYFYLPLEKQPKPTTHEYIKGLALYGGPSLAAAITLECLNISYIPRCKKWFKKQMGKTVMELLTEYQHWFREQELYCTKTFNDIEGYADIKQRLHSHINHISDNSNNNLTRIKHCIFYNKNDGFFSGIFKKHWCYATAHALQQLNVQRRIVEIPSHDIAELTVQQILTLLKNGGPSIIIIKKNTPTKDDQAYAEKIISLIEKINEFNIQTHLIATLDSIPCSQHKEKFTSLSTECIHIIKPSYTGRYNHIQKWISSHSELSVQNYDIALLAERTNQLWFDAIDHVMQSNYNEKKSNLSTASILQAFDDICPLTYNIKKNLFHSQLDVYTGDLNEQLLEE